MNVYRLAAALPTPTAWTKRIIQAEPRHRRAWRKTQNTRLLLLATGDSDVLPTIREQKHLLHHRSHCCYRHRPQSAPRVLAQGLPRPAVGFMNQQNRGED